MRALVIGVVASAALIGGCRPDVGESGSLAPGSFDAAPSASLPARIPLPDDFPVLPGASPIAMPDDDPGMIGRWVTDRPGSAAYDFFLDALPSAGYGIRGAFAGDTVAQFLIVNPRGARWQIDLYANADLSTRIELRLPRP